MAEAPKKPPDAARPLPPAPAPPPQQSPTARPPLCRLKVVVRGMPAGVDPELARETIARAAGGEAMVQWFRVWGASER